jgi:hypothetical protein
VSWTQVAQSVVDAIVSWSVFAFLTWAWAKRKLLPFLRNHAPAMLALYEKEVGDEHAP